MIYPLNMGIKKLEYHKKKNPGPKTRILLCL